MSDIPLTEEEARRIANSLEHLYYDTKESAYDATDKQAARDAMTIRTRAGITPNPYLFEEEPGENAPDAPERP